MKVVKFVLVGFLPLCIGGSGCPSDGNPIPSTRDQQLVGTWQGQSFFCGDQTARWTFNADGTGTLTNTYFCTGQTVVNWSTPGSAVLQIETGTPAGTASYTYSISGNTLSLSSAGTNRTYTKI